MSVDLSVADKLLLAAADLDGGEGRTFSAEDLVVAAWERFPETFGLRGHLGDSGVPKYPDSNRVFAEIMGSKPVRSRGFIEKVGNKRYRLTEAGRQSIGTRTGRAAPRKASLDRDALDRFRRLLHSRAAEKDKSKRFDDITFHDACGFWGITPRSNAKDLANKLIDLEAHLDMVTAMTAQEDFALTHGGDTYTQADIERLRALSKRLEEQFGHDLEYIRSRRTER